MDRNVYTVQSHVCVELWPRPTKNCEHPLLPTPYICPIFSTHGTLLFLKQNMTIVTPHYDFQNVTFLIRKSLRNIVISEKCSYKKPVLRWYENLFVYNVHWGQTYSTCKRDRDREIE